MAKHENKRSASRSGGVGPQPNGPSRGRNLSRRSLLSWLGNATALALAPDLFASCAREASPVDLRNSGAPAGTTTESGTFAFAPSPVEGSLYDNWFGNTVDQQDLVQLLASWQLAVGGLVEQALTLSFAELLQLPRQDQVTDFHCVEGWSVLDVPWNGIHIDRLMELVRPTSAATHVTFHCFGDVYAESLPLSVSREPRTLLAYGIGGRTLPLTHGFPLRLVVPRLLGYKSAKWVKQIEFTNASEAGYWEQRGYSTEALVPESRLRDGKY